MKRLYGLIVVILHSTWLGLATGTAFADDLSSESHLVARGCYIAQVRGACPVNSPVFGVWSTMRARPATFHPRIYIPAMEAKARFCFNSPFLEKCGSGRINFDGDQGSNIFTGVLSQEN